MITELIVIYGCKWDKELEDLRKTIIDDPDHKLSNILDEDDFFKGWILRKNPDLGVYGYLGRSIRIIEEGEPFKPSDLKMFSEDSNVGKAIRKTVKNYIDSQPPEVQDLLEEPQVHIIWNWY